MPVLKGRYSYAIVFLNRRTDGTPSEVTDSDNTVVTHAKISQILRKKTLNEKTFF